MTGTGRGSTKPGHAAALPEGRYQPAPTTAEVTEVTEFVVQFHGEDGRHKDYPVNRLPLPGWHRGLTMTLDDRFGPQGTRRTRASTQGRPRS